MGYYSDTDSFLTDQPLPANLVDNKKLGLMKLEDEYICSVFLGPKLYGCMDITGESYSKVKGFKDEIPLEILSNLYIDEFFIHLF